MVSTGCEPAAFQQMPDAVSALHRCCGPQPVQLTCRPVQQGRADDDDWMHGLPASPLCCICATLRQGRNAAAVCRRDVIRAGP